MPQTRAQATAAIVAEHRRFGLVKRRRPIPRQRYPKSIEFAYAQAMVALVDRARAAFAPLIAELPRLLESARRARKDDDAPGSEGTRARRLIDFAKENMAQAIDVHALTALASKFAKRTEVYQREQLQRQVRAGLGADVMVSDKTLPAIVDHFVAANVSLIESIPAQVHDQVSRVVTQAFSSGTPVDDVQADIAKRFSVGESRARLIARDQIGKLAGQVNASRQQALGLTSFIWRTVGDERVRDEHQDRDGETYNYDDPPDGELPGEPIQCRCSAEPVFEDVLDPDPSIPDTAADVTNERKVHEVGAQALHDRGYFEPAAGFQDGARLEKAREIIRSGQRDPVTMIIGHNGALEVADGRHRLRAAVELGAQVKVRYVRGVAGEGGSLVKRGGVPPVPPTVLMPTPVAAVVPTPEPVEPVAAAAGAAGAPPKNPKRVEAAKKAGEESAMRRREIHSAVKGNLPSELHVAWDKEGHKFLKQEAGRIKGMKDRINAASKISEAFAETYGSGDASVIGNEGDRFHERQELEAKHAETWADEQERKYYEEAHRAAMENGDINEHGDLTKHASGELDEWGDPIGHSTNTNHDDPPF